MPDPFTFLDGVFVIVFGIVSLVLISSLAIDLIQLFSAARSWFMARFWRKKMRGRRRR